MKKAVYITLAACISFYAGQASAKIEPSSDYSNSKSRYVAGKEVKVVTPKLPCEQQKNLTLNGKCTKSDNACKARARKTALAALNIGPKTTLQSQ